MVGVGVLALGVAVFLVTREEAYTGPRSVDGDPLAELTLEPGATQNPASPQLRAEGDLDRVLPARPGDVIHLELAQITDASMVRVEFVVPVAQEGESPRPVRIYAGHQPPVELETLPLSGDRTRLRIDVQPGTFSQAGKYVVEVVSTEPGALPVRRFAIEVH